MTAAGDNPLRVAVPRAPVLLAGFREALWLTPDGEIEALSPDEARGRLDRETPMLCHMPATARRLGVAPFPALDLLELFAFVRPARFCVPTPRGLAEALGLVAPHNPSEACVALATAARALLQELGADADPEARALAEAADRGGWVWGPAVLAALPAPDDPRPRRAAGLRVWLRLREWSEAPPAPPPGNAPVSAAEARGRLAALLGDGAEPRPQQADYAAAVAPAFAPRDLPDAPNAVLAEAGTGVGKTLGYIAPASLWAEKNDGAVWVSTFTRNLQNQIAGELDRLYPDPAQKRRRVVIRKGRENFLCLLNYEEAARGAGMRGSTGHLALVARWVAATRSGDLVAGDFPGWLTELIGRFRINGIADRRGECVHSACPHFRRCFVERNIREARQARIVVANHALVMTQAALGGLDDNTVPTRYVFDEAHHLLDAADSAFSVRVSGQEGRELRRWILGGESGAASRARGLRQRIGDLVEDDEAGGKALLDLLVAARILPANGWHQRVAEGRGLAGFESFLVLVRRQALARHSSGGAALADSGYGLQAEARPPIPGLVEAAARLAEGLDRVADGLRRLSAALRTRLEDAENPPDPGLRQRLDATIRGLDRRADLLLAAWARLLRDIGEAPRPDTVEWLSLDRSDGLETDVALSRNWVDPGIPFAHYVARPAHGLVVTSATLTDGDGEGDPAQAWRAAEAGTGLRHLPQSPRAARLASPFDYAAQTRIFIATDIPRDDVGQVAAAYATLLAASGGGALGLFTAITRLRAVHERIAPVLEERGLLLLAQHVDAMSTATLVDIFRAEEDSCLLGTDAMRDGVDVPGRSLRLIVFDRVPWPRPDILHRARKPHFGGAQYEDRIARLRLRQAYGRLVRRSADRGVFVILDRALPSRLLAAFPRDVPIARLPLADAAAATARFLDPSASG
ncbi:MAG: ATP-dependent DNA helicase [Alphaproteobacteria bacterium]|nr:ATP-dependent DNA helicase [Alphaproteobacteria bacterium]